MRHGAGCMGDRMASRRIMGSVQQVPKVTCLHIVVWCAYVPQSRLKPRYAPARGRAISTASETNIKNVSETLRRAVFSFLFMME